MSDTATKPAVDPAELATAIEALTQRPFLQGDDKVTGWNNAILAALKLIEAAANHPEQNARQLLVTAGMRGVGSLLYEANRQGGAPGV